MFGLTEKNNGNVVTATEWNTIVDKGMFQADNLAELRNYVPSSAVKGFVYVKGHTTPGGGGHGVFEALYGQPPGTYTDDNGITIVPTGGDRSSCWRRVFSGAVNVRWYGAQMDGTDELTEINSAIASGYGEVVIDGPIAVSAPVSLTSNVTLTFVGNGSIKALNTMPHILGTASAAENVTINYPVVDGDNIRGLNGIGIGTNTTDVKNITVINPTVRNCLRSPTTGGGRGIAAQNGVEGLTVLGAVVKDCTTGYDLNGDSSAGTLLPVDGIYIQGYAENCQEAVSLYSDGTSTTVDLDSIFARLDIVARNCGRTTDTTLYSGAGVAGDKDGGVIVSRRGRNAKIKLIVLNDTTYTIGSVFRGTGNNIQVDFEFSGNADAPIIVGSAENLLPLANANDASYGLNIKGRVYGTLTNLLDHRINNTLTYRSCYAEIETFSFAGNILASTAAAFRTDDVCVFRDLDNGRTITGRASDIYTTTNTFAAVTDTVTYVGASKFVGAANFTGLITAGGDLLIPTGKRIKFTDVAGAAGAIVEYAIVQKSDGTTYKLALYAV